MSYSDSCFTQLCNLMAHPSVVVRHRACVLLCSVGGVSDSLVTHTLAQPDDIQDMLGMNSDETASLLEYGGEGCLFYALEDEAASVRQAAIDAVAVLCLDCPLSVFVTAFNNIIDMFTDESLAVRLHALGVVAHLAVNRRVELGPQHLQVVWRMLDEPNGKIQQGARRVLSSCHVTQPASLVLTLRHVIDSAEKSRDYESSMACAFAIGNRNPFFAGLVLPSLLEPSFTSKPVSYDTVLMFMTGVLTGNPNGASGLPQHVISDIEAARYRFSNILELCSGAPKPIHVTDKDVLCKTFGQKMETLFTSLTPALMFAIEAEDISRCNQLIDNCKRELRNAIQYLPETAHGRARFALLAIECIECLRHELCVEADDSRMVTTDETDKKAPPNLLSYVTESCDQMIVLFTGLSQYDEDCIALYRTLALLTSACTLTSSATNSLATGVEGECSMVATDEQSFLEALATSRRHMAEESAASTALNRLIQIAQSPTKSSRHTLREFCLQHRLLPLRWVQLRLISATLQVPQTSADHAMVAHTALPVPIRIEGCIANTNSLKLSAIQCECQNHVTTQIVRSSFAHAKTQCPFSSTVMLDVSGAQGLIVVRVWLGVTTQTTHNNNTVTKWVQASKPQNIFVFVRNHE
eukprot:c11430_g1_i1.p1 GENE.c11430_g1_i1~~c11430_g1_i1.p1  ORF type:complete len:660 (-),score=170.06 c11430_g1_i1:862-2775(-)